MMLAVRRHWLAIGTVAVVVAVVSMMASASRASVREGQAGAAASRYLGQPTPGLTPERFAPGIVSTPAMEINGVFTPDFREFVFARQVDGTFGLFHSTLEGGRWSPPRPLRLYPGGAPGLAVDMAISPDGLEMFFMGRFTPGVAAAEATNSDIWVSRRRNGAWTTAEVVPPPVSTDVFESYPTVAADGSLYFVSNRAGGVGRSDIYRAPRLPDRSFGTPANIGRPANTDAGEGDPFVSPDERYLIITKDGEFGQADLFVSFRAADGKCGEPVNLCSTINTSATEFCPMVTPDGRYLFFSRRFGGDSWQTATEADVFWVDIGILERAKR